MINKKIKEYIKHIKKYFYNNPLYLVVVLMFIIMSELFWLLFMFNKIAIIMIVPFFFIFYQIWLNSEDKKQLSKSSLLTFGSITIAIFFFLFQNFQVDYNHTVLMNITKIHNCNTIKLYINELPNNSHNYGLNPLIINTYQDNYDFLRKKIGEKKLLLFIKNIQRMERINKLVEITQGNIKKQHIEYNNEQIVTISKKINEEYCQNKDI